MSLESVALRFELVARRDLLACALLLACMVLASSAGAQGGDSGAVVVVPSNRGFTVIPTSRLDTDGDGVPDGRDSDDDGDGVPDSRDAFPRNPRETADFDGDGVGDNADPDDDNDGVPDARDAFPRNPLESMDANGNGVGDNEEIRRGMPGIPRPSPPPLADPDSVFRRTVRFDSMGALSQFLSSQGAPLCLPRGFQFGFATPAGGLFVPGKLPAEDDLCSERPGFRIIFGGGGSGRVEVITFPDIMPLADHLRALQGLLIAGDCPDEAPKWVGCFPLPEIGERAPVRLPTFVFDNLGASQDRMVVDRFLNTCRLHELILPQPRQGDPSSFDQALIQFAQIGIQPVVGPGEDFLRSAMGDAVSTCPTDPRALIPTVESQLTRLSYPIDVARRVINDLLEKGARLGEILEDLIRACDDLAMGDRCVPRTVGGVLSTVAGTCSAQLSTIPSFPFDTDSEFGLRRLCLAGFDLRLPVRCARSPGLPECQTFASLQMAGVDPTLAETLAGTALEQAQVILDALLAIDADTALRIAGRLSNLFSSGSCTSRSKFGEICTVARIPGNCIPQGEGDPICFPTSLLALRGLVDDLVDEEQDACRGQGRDGNGDGICDACEMSGGADADGDGVCDNVDNCPNTPNEKQEDADQDGVGDACSACADIRKGDADMDGVMDCVDPCLLPPGVVAPNPLSANCGCKPVFGSGQGQQILWPDQSSVSIHVDLLQCNAPGGPANAGPFVLRDVSRQAVNSALTGHGHDGAMGGGFGPDSQEIVTSVVPPGGGSQGSIVMSSSRSLMFRDQRSRAAVDAAVYAQLYYDFLRANGFVSFSDLPALATMASRVGVTPGAPGQAGAAAFTQEGFDFYVAYNDLAEGSAITNFQSAAGDSVGHEWTHAFATFGANGVARMRGENLCGTCDLSPPVENVGAAVEEFAADTIGTAFEFFFAPRIPGGKRPNYFIGEDSTGGQGFIRSLADPTRNARPTPDHVRHRLFQANCIVSSGTRAVPEACMGPFVKWAFLAAEGTSGFPTIAQQNAGGFSNESPVAVVGIGIEKVKQLVFRALQNHWAKDQVYDHYVQGILRAAQDLAFSTADQAAVLDAFRAVGLR